MAISIATPPSDISVSGKLGGDGVRLVTRHGAGGGVDVEEAMNHALWMRGADIQSSIARCADIFNSGVFSQGNASNPLFEAAVTLVLIHLSDLLKKASDDGQRISWTDDVIPSAKISDVTDLIREARNAAVHTSSGNHKIEPSIKFSFSACFGYAPQATVINGVVLGCHYKDEIAIFYGTIRVYMKRQLVGCLEKIIEMYPPPEPKAFELPLA